MLELGDDVVYRFNNKEDMLHFANSVNWSQIVAIETCSITWDMYERESKILCIRATKNSVDKYILNYCSLSWYEEMGYNIILYTKNVNAVELL